MSIADRFVTQFMPGWMRREKQAASAVKPLVKSGVSRSRPMAPKPVTAFKPKPLNPDQYSTHL
ncbi:MAG: hypothetical protein KF874_00025 [Rhizobiaceae bacterium]|nr:hypothetical protein [Rhizobiaceae bacterium]